MFANTRRNRDDRIKGGFYLPIFHDVQWPWLLNTYIHTLSSIHQRCFQHNRCCCCCCYCCSEVLASRNWIDLLFTKGRKKWTKGLFFPFAVFMCVENTGGKSFFSPFFWVKVDFLRGINYSAATFEFLTDFCFPSFSFNVGVYLLRQRRSSSPNCCCCC